MRKLILLFIAIALFSCQENDTYYKYEIIEFYSWDMTNENEREIPICLDIYNIEAIEALIYSDLNEIPSHLSIKSYNELINDSNGFITIEKNNVKLEINILGCFNSDSFNNLNQKRGYIIIKHIP